MLVGSAIVVRVFRDRVPYFTDELFAAWMFEGSFSIVNPLLFTNKRRRYVMACAMAYLSSIQTEAETRSASSIIALVGGVDPDKALQFARTRFRCISFENFTPDGFAARPQGNAQPNPFFVASTLTQLGCCDAFVAHSGRDNGAQKYQGATR